MVLGRLVGPKENMAAVVDRLHLFDTDLRGAFVGDANLQAALLGGAHLQGASLRDADLRGASLVYALLSDVSLHGTDLRGDDLHVLSSRALGIWTMPTSAARRRQQDAVAGRLRRCRGRRPVRSRVQLTPTWQCLLAMRGLAENGPFPATTPVGQWP
jgi:hypothetical protein